MTMSHNKKILVLLFSLVAMLLAACTAPTTPLTQTAVSPASGASITVVGYGEVFGIPNQAQAQVGVEILAPTVTEASNQNQATMQQVMDALAAQGIAPEDIQTTNYSIWADQTYGDHGPEGISGYHVSNQVTITVRDINKIGDVLTAVTDAGANTINGVTFTVSDPAALEAHAREAAMNNARARAEELARLGGVSIGSIQFISEIVGQTPMPLAANFDRTVVESAAPSISPGQLSYAVQIQVTYTIQ
jgi:uncharacterized protein YggE